MLELCGIHSALENIYIVWIENQEFLALSKSPMLDTPPSRLHVGVGVNEYWHYRCAMRMCTPFDGIKTKHCYFVGLVVVQNWWKSRGFYLPHSTGHLSATCWHPLIRTSSERKLSNTTKWVKDTKSKNGLWSSAVSWTSRVLPLLSKIGPIPCILCVSPTVRSSNLDPHGYLSCDPSDVEACMGLDVPLEKLHAPACNRCLLQRKDSARLGQAMKISWSVGAVTDGKLSGWKYGQRKG